MTQIDWYSGIVVTMDPDAVLDYEMEFADWLGNKTLASHTVTAVNCEVTAVTAPTATSVAFRVAEVSVGASVKVRCETGDGLIDDFTIRFRPQEK